MTGALGSDIADIPASRKLTNIVFAFVLVGPPAGAIGLLILGPIWGMAIGGNQIHLPVGDLCNSLPSAVNTILVVVGFSYFAGAIPAAVAGLLVGVVKIRRGRVSGGTALMCGALIGIGYVVATEAVSLGSYGNIWDNSVLKVSICIFSTMLCWSLVRNWYPGRQL